MIVEKTPQMTPEQVRRNQLQIDWLISALRRASERRGNDAIQEPSLSIRRRCPTCGAELPAAT